ncbi:MAG TPA: hypothetical protein VJQ59_16745 [Candidatus Sulfotelmatobacter sp.]|nr:hypothetical protein [Candidatus Sulfotelmatobacter sp.]
MGASAYFAELARIKAEQQMEKYRQSIGAAHDKFAYLAAGRPPDMDQQTYANELQKAWDAYEKKINVGPAEDQTQHGGLIGAIGRLVHHHTALSNQPQVAPSQTTQPGLNTSISAVNGGSIAPNGDQASISFPFAPPGAAASPPPPSPGDVSRGTLGAENALAGTGPDQANPISAAAGAGAAPPAAVASAAEPIPPLIPPWMSQSDIANTRLAGQLKIQNDAALAQDLANIKQRQDFMAANPEMFQGLDPFQKLEFLSKENIQRGILPSLGLASGTPTIIDQDFIQRNGSLDMNGNPFKVGDLAIPEIDKRFGTPTGRYVSTPVKTVGGPVTVGAGGETLLNRVNPYAPPSSVPGALASTLGQLNVNNGVRLVPQADGSIKEVPVTTEDLREKILPGVPMLPPPPGTNVPAGARPVVAPPAQPQRPVASVGVRAPGRVVGGRPLPEATREKMDAQLQAFNNTIDLMNRVKQNLPVLNDLLSAGKIQLATSPEGLAQVISRSTNLTDQEAQMAADMQSLAEHINTLRGPLGATGFRGHEAFGALQAQRGQALANPKVTAAIIDNTLRALGGQRDAISRSFKQHGIEVPASPSLAPPPGTEQRVIVEGPDPKNPGKTGRFSLPASQLDQAIKQGYKKVGQ